MIGGFMFNFEGKAIPKGKEAEVLAALQEKIPLVTNIFCDEAGVEVRTRHPGGINSMVLRSGTGGNRRFLRDASVGLRAGIEGELNSIIPTLEQ